MAAETSVRTCTKYWYPAGPASGLGREPDLRAGIGSGRPTRDGLLWLPRKGTRYLGSRYWIYANDGDGGLVDRDTPVCGPLDDPGWVFARLAYPGGYIFLIRSFSECGDCEYGLDSFVRVTLDAAGLAVL